MVDVSTDGGPAVLLVDQRTSQRTGLLGALALSPDGHYLLSVREDVASGGTLTEIGLYRADGFVPQLVWHRALVDWRPRHARWRYAHLVVLQQAHTDPGGDVLTGIAAHIRRTGIAVYALASPVASAPTACCHQRSTARSAGRPTCAFCRRMAAGSSSGSP